jgi:hypothetical protein
MKVLMADNLTEYFSPVSDFWDVAKQSIKGGEDIESMLSRYVALRDKKGLANLYAEFTEVFGKGGEDIVSKPLSANELNGNDDIKAGADESNYFPGRHFSLPLMAYIMRRALDKSDADKSYQKYVKNVDVLVAEENEHIEECNAKILADFEAEPENESPKFMDLVEIHAYPSQPFIEGLCAESLDQLAELKIRKDNEISHDHCDASDGDIGMPEA